jgi:hypothetical protein
MREATYGTDSRMPMVTTWNRRSESSGTLYTIMLHNDGVMTCDCPGWCVQKRDKKTNIMKPRECKHVRELVGEATRVLRGQVTPPPRMTPPPILQPTTPPVQTKTKESAGRLLRLD